MSVHNRGKFTKTDIVQLILMSAHIILAIPAYIITLVVYELRHTYVCT